MGGLFVCFVIWDSLLTERKTSTCIIKTSTCWGARGLEMQPRQEGKLGLDWLEQEATRTPSEGKGGIIAQVP